MKTITHVTIALLDYPISGDVQMLTRCRQQDKNLIDHGAAALGMSTSAFIRMVGTKAAAEILAQADKQIEAEPIPLAVPEPAPKTKNIRHTLSRTLPPGVKA